MKQRILVADDEPDIRNLIAIYLQAEGFLVDQVSNGKEALEALKKNQYELVLLDIMMPVMDGIETLLRIRQEYTMPVIFLTAKSTELDMIQGLTLGADDYITKPFGSMQLIARVKAQLRRYTVFNQASNHNIIRIDGLEINTDMHLVTVDGEEKDLTPTEYKILELLARNRNIVFSAEKIYETIWRDKCTVSDTSIMVHITRLRQKIEKDSKNPYYIKTVWGVGYKI